MPLTFTLSDFGLTSLEAFAPTVELVASDAGVKNGRLFASTPVAATPLGGGLYEVTLEGTDGVVPQVWYKVRITHLQPGGKFTHFDILNYKLFVPDGFDGSITDLPGVPLAPNSVWTNLNPPPPDFKGWWLYSPGEGQEMPLDDPDIGDLRPVT